LADWVEPNVAVMALLNESHESPGITRKLGNKKVSPAPILAPEPNHAPEVVEAEEQIGPHPNPREARLDVRH